MIGQHIILRCKNGIYSESMAAGYKTAAVSKSICSMSKNSQHELDYAITTAAAMPDGVPQGGNAEMNRGVVHFVPYKDIILVIRIRRVNDLCTYSGTVSFAHTFILSGDEKKALLSSPSVITDISRFDTYEAVDSRCGGLFGDGEVIVDEELTLLKGNTEPPLNVFEDAGFDEESFSVLISAICSSLCRNIYTAVIPKNVYADDWEKEGGSLCGEQLISEVLRLMPDFISGKLSCTSYWGENPEYTGINSIKLRVLSGEYVDGLQKSYISLFDMKRNIINTNGIKAGPFGKMLWKLRNDAEKLAGFHAELEKLLGESGSKLKKSPEVMDMLTEAIKYRNGEKVDHEQLLNLLLTTIGSAIGRFHLLKEIADTLIKEAISGTIKCDRETEELFAEMLENDEDAENMASFLFKRISDGTAGTDTIERLAELAVENDTVNKCHRRFISLVGELTDKDVPKSVVDYLFFAFDNLENNTDTKELYEAIDKIYYVLFSQKKYHECLRICKKIISSDNDFSKKKIFSWLADIICACEKCEELLENAVGIASANLLILSAYGSDETVKFAEKLFGCEETSARAEKRILFPLFIKLLQCAIGDKGYCQNIWSKQYKNIVANKCDDEFFMNPESLLDQYQGEELSYSLFYIELAKIAGAKDYLSTWETIDMIEKGLKDKKIAFKYTRAIVNSNIKLKNSNALLQNIKGTKRIYQYYYGLFDDPESQNDEKKNVLKVIASNLSGSEKENAMKCFIHEAEFDENCEKYFCDNITDICQAIYDYNNPSIPKEKMGIFLYEINRALSGKTFEARAMQNFVSLVKEYASKEDTLINADEKIIAMIHKGLNAYKWKNGIPADTILRINMCYSIDDFSQESFDFLVNETRKADMDISHPLRKIIRRANMTLRNNAGCIMNDNFDDKKDKLILMSLIYITLLSSEKKASEYLEFLRGKDESFRDGEFLIRGMSVILNCFPSTKKNTSLLQGMTYKLENVILQSGKYDNTFNSIISCKAKYIGEVKKHLDSGVQRKLYAAANNVLNAVEKERREQYVILRDMFKIEYLGDRSGSSSAKLIWNLIFALIYILCIVIEIMTWKYVSPIASLILSVIICVTAFILGVKIAKGADDEI